MHIYIYIHTYIICIYIYIVWQTMELLLCWFFMEPLITVNRH